MSDGTSSLLGGEGRRGSTAGREEGLRCWEGRRGSAAGRGGGAPLLGGEEGRRCWEGRRGSTAGREGGAPLLGGEEGLRCWEGRRGAAAGGKEGLHCSVEVTTCLGRHGRGSQCCCVPWAVLCFWQWKHLEEIKNRPHAKGNMGLAFTLHTTHCIIEL